MRCQNQSIGSSSKQVEIRNVPSCKGTDSSYNRKLKVENQTEDNETQDKNHRYPDNKNEYRKTNNDPVISMEADDSVNENYYVFYSQYVSRIRMEESNPTQISATETTRQLAVSANLNNYASVAQYPPLPS